MVDFPADSTANAKRFGFRVLLAQAAPKEAQNAEASARAAICSALVAIVLEEKDKDLAAGIGADGAKLVAISEYTRTHRHSAMGPADPNAPPLIPAWGLSRTRSLLTAEPTPNHTGVDVFWLFDPKTRKPWGEILEYHRDGEGHLPVRNVFGLSPKCLARVRKRLAKWWGLYKTGQAPILIPKPPAPLPKPPLAPKFTWEPAPVYHPKFPELAVAKNKKVVSHLKVNGNVYTFGASVGGKVSAAALKRGIANGTFSGFHKWDPATGQLVVTPPPTPPKPAKPKTPAKPKPAPAPKPKPTTIPIASPPPPRTTAVTPPTTAPPAPKLPVRPPLRIVPAPAPTPPPKKPPAAKKAKPPALPDSLEGLQTVKALGGHSGANATLVVDQAGRKFVRKEGARNPGQLREEVHADAAYQALGVAVPKSKIVDVGGIPHKLSQFHEGVDLGVLMRTDPARAEAAMKKLREGFVADALLGNWDVVGASFDNVKVLADGTVLRIDNGGALRYRAQGSLKGSQWSKFVGELHSLRDPNVNANAAKVFGSLTDAEIRLQIKAILKKRAKLLAAVPDDLKETLSERLDYLKAWAAPKPKPRSVNGWTPAPEGHFTKVPSGEENDWANRHFKRWGDALSRAETSAMREYTGSGYPWMNAALRSDDGASSSDDERAKLDALRAALARAETGEGVVVYRGIRNGPATLGFDPSRIQTGDEIVFRGFTSTSLAYSSSFSGDTKLTIRVPKGFKGGGAVNATKGSSFPREKEFLLNHLSRARVVAYEFINGKHRITLEMIP